MWATASSTKQMAVTAQPTGLALREVCRVVQAVHARGNKLTAHATIADGARVAAAAGVDAIEHGFAIDPEVARTMAAKDATLVSMLSVLASFETFARTTHLDRFASEAGQRRTAERREQAFASVRAVRQAGVRIATGQRPA